MGNQLAKSIFDGVIERFQKLLTFFSGHAFHCEANGITADQLPIFNDHPVKNILFLDL